MTLADGLEYSGCPAELAAQIVTQLNQLASQLRPLIDTKCEELVLYWCADQWLLGAEEGGTPGPDRAIFPNSAIRVLVDACKYPELPPDRPAKRAKFAVDWEPEVARGRLVCG